MVVFGTRGTQLGTAKCYVQLDKVVLEGINTLPPLTYQTARILLMWMQLPPPFHI